jgi:hypothetical protein
MRAQSFHWVADEAVGETSAKGRTRFANNPRTSETSQLIAAALTSGFRLVEPGGFRDTIEQTERGLVRRVEWFIDGASRAAFRCGEPEEIEFPEFRRRFQSEAWCQENPDHPIAFLRWTFRTYGELQARFAEMKPASLLRRGNRQVILPADTPEEHRQKLLAYLR